MTKLSRFSKNIADKVSKKYQAGLRCELQEIFNAKTLQNARKKKDEIPDSYRDVAEAAIICRDEGFESAMTAMILLAGMRTSNYIERLDKELKRLSKVIGIFSNYNSLLQLMESILIEHHKTVQNGRAVFGKEHYDALLKSEAWLCLVDLAKEQHLLLAA